MKWLMRILGKGKKNRAGFTLVELMVVVIIVGILAAAAVPIYRFAVRKAYISEARAALGAIRSAELVYHAENEDYLGVSVGDIGEPEGSGGLRLDVTNNTWFNEAGAFSVDVTNDVGGDELVDKFQARCDGTLLTGGQPAVVKTIAISLDHAGNWDEGTIGDDGSVTWPAY